MWVKNYKRRGHVDSLPGDYKFMSVKQKGDLMRVYGKGDRMEDNPKERKMDMLKSMHEGEGMWATATGMVWDNRNKFTSAIMRCTAKAVSNGSFKERRGMSATVLFEKDIDSRMVAANKVPGEYKDQSAYRSKLAGITASIQMIK